MAFGHEPHGTIPRDSFHDCRQGGFIQLKISVSVDLTSFTVIDANKVSITRYDVPSGRRDYTVNKVSTRLGRLRTEYINRREIEVA